MDMDVRVQAGVTREVVIYAYLICTTKQALTLTLTLTTHILYALPRIRTGVTSEVSNQGSR